MHSKLEGGGGETGTWRANDIAYRPEQPEQADTTRENLIHKILAVARVKKKRYYYLPLAPDK